MAAVRDKVEAAGATAPYRPRPDGARRRPYRPDPNPIEKRGPTVTPFPRSAAAQASAAVTADDRRGSFESCGYAVN